MEIAVEREVLPYDIIELKRGDKLVLFKDGIGSAPEPGDEVQFLAELDFDPRNNSDVHTLFCRYSKPNTGWCVIYAGEVFSVNGREVVR